MKSHYIGMFAVITGFGTVLAMFKLESEANNWRNTYRPDASIEFLEVRFDR